MPREIWDRWHPGDSFHFRGPHAFFAPVPALISWTIDSGVKQLPYLDVDQANALLQEVLPYAQALLSSLWVVDEPSGDLDWSADAVHAGRQIGRLCSRYRQASADRQLDGDLVDYGQIVARFPQAFQPRLLGLPLDKLDQECEGITRFLGGDRGPWHPEIKTVFGAALSERDPHYVSLEVLGVRAWYRAAIADGDPRPVRDFTGWHAEHPGRSTGLTSTTTDTELARWVERVEAEAGEAGYRLRGTAAGGEEVRAQLRAQDWDRLAVVGARVAELEEELAPLKTERQKLIFQAIDWGQSDSAIAGRARLTRQAVHKLRTAEKVHVFNPDTIAAPNDVQVSFTRQEHPVAIVIDETLNIARPDIKGIAYEARDDDARALTEAKHILLYHSPDDEVWALAAGLTPEDVEPRLLSDLADPAAADAAREWAKATLQRRGHRGEWTRWPATDQQPPSYLWRAHS